MVTLPLPAHKHFSYISLRSFVPELASCLQPAFLDGRPACPSMEGRAASGEACRASSTNVILFRRTLKVLMRRSLMYIKTYLVGLIHHGMSPVLACKGTDLVLGPGVQSPRGQDVT